MHVINLDIQDNHEEATVGAFHICEMCQAVSSNSNTVEYAIYCLLGNMEQFMYIQKTMQMKSKQYVFYPSLKFQPDTPAFLRVNSR